jgi:hypothetical protein
MRHNYLTKYLSIGILYKSVNKKEHQSMFHGITDAPTPYLQGGMTC